MDFESATPSVVKSIKQRDLLNTWIRLHVREQRLPRLADYAPERLEDEKLDLVYYTVDTSLAPPRLTILSENTRMAAAYGRSGKGQLLEDFLGPLLVPVVMPVYQECVRRALPVFTIAHIDDAYGRIVAFERLLLPFSNGKAVTGIVASLKTISEDGNFELRNLMHGGGNPPTPKLRTVIDRELVHRMPGRAIADDVIEFE
jgi:hypothetical protein